MGGAIRRKIDVNGKSKTVTGKNKTASGIKQDCKWEQVEHDVFTEPTRRREPVLRK